LQSSRTSPSREKKAGEKWGGRRKVTEGRTAKGPWESNASPVLIVKVLKKTRITIDPIWVVQRGRTKARGKKGGSEKWKSKNTNKSGQENGRLVKHAQENIFPRCGPLM